MIKMALSVTRIAAFCLALALISSCGSSAPNGGSITSTPDSYTVTVPATGANSSISGPNLGFTVVIKTRDGAPVVNTPIYIYTPQDPITPVDTTIRIIDANGVATGPFVIPSPYTVYTDTSGAINVEISIPIITDATYGDTISFSSGNLRKDNTINVKCVNSTSFTCPP